MKNKVTFSTFQIIINTIILGIVASVSHFAYELSGENFIVGLFNPINESVWEHLKFMFFPFLLWWIIVYFIKRKNSDIEFDVWIVASCIALILAPLSVALLYYFYTGVLGIESLIIDILLVFIGYFIALKVASHILKYAHPNKLMVILSIIFVATIGIAFIVFTIL